MPKGSGGWDGTSSIGEGGGGSSFSFGGNDFTSAGRGGWDTAGVSFTASDNSCSGISMGGGAGGSDADKLRAGGFSRCRTGKSRRARFAMMDALAKTKAAKAKAAKPKATKTKAPAKKARTPPVPPSKPACLSEPKKAPSPGPETLLSELKAVDPVLKSYIEERGIGVRTMRSRAVRQKLTKRAFRGF